MAKQLQLKISLKGSKPPIWRRLLLTDDITFAKLHLIIQDAMGWDNYHLYEFKLGAWASIGIPYEGSFDEIMDARTIKISKYLKKKGDKMVYNYDFGDDWEHTLSVEEVGLVVSTEKYPRCIKGKGNCPPEDCGGIWGFYDLVEKIQDPKHPDHKDTLEWLGGNYDPTAFDIEDINQRLSANQ